MIKELLEKIFDGYLISREEALSLLATDVNGLAGAADGIRRHFCGNSFDICTIINGKSGKCSENCKYCAQSAHYSGSAEEYPLLGKDEILEDAMYNDRSGILRYSVVTSGRRLSDDEVSLMCEAYALIRKNSGIALCASHGLLNFGQLARLKEAGVSRYHNNIETSRRNFPNICTTHTFDDKIETIRAAQRAGLSVCSGGIMGLGETQEDRVDMALELRGLGIKSVPINFLSPIPGTPLEKLSPIEIEEARRITAIFRFILPGAAIRIAGGRGLMQDKGRVLFSSGANAAISGDMLTTSGISVKDDLNMLSELGYSVNML